MTGSPEIVVGVIGGMGPAATVDLMRRIVEATPARDDRDHLRVLVDNNPKVPSRIAHLLEGGGESPAQCLAEMARGLEAAGAGLLAMPCNTAHHYYDHISCAVAIPLLDLRRLVADTLAAQQPRPVRIGLLATTTLQRIDLYGPALASQGMQALFPPPELQERLMALIRAVKAGDDNEAARAALPEAALALERAGADCLLLACTELSVLAQQLSAGPPLYDAAQVLAEAVVLRARAG